MEVYPDRNENKTKKKGKILYHRNVYQLYFNVNCSKDTYFLNKWMHLHTIKLKYKLVCKGP